MNRTATAPERRAGDVGGAPPGRHPLTLASASYCPWSQVVIATRDRVLGMVIASRGFVEGVR
jgi:hypothetical protein